MSILFLIPVIFLLTGLALSIIGWRGKKLNDHPHCRKCRFDLFGSPDAKICPECGHDLKKEKAVRHGIRAKRRGMLGTGCALLLLFAVQTGMGVYFAAVDINWQHVKPVWWLVNEANETPGPTSDAALIELRRRQDSGELKALQIEKLIELALKHQADDTRPWQVEWGNMIQVADNNGNLTGEQKTKFAENIIDNIIHLKMRPKIRHGSGLKYQLEEKSARAGDLNPPTSMWLRLEGKEFKISQYSYKPTGSSGTSISHGGSGTSTSSVTISQEQWETIETGEYTAEFSVNLSLFSSHSATETDLPLATKTITLTDKTTVVQNATISLNSDEAIEQQVTDAVRLESVEAGQYSYEKRKGQWHVDIELNFGKRPADIAIDIILKLGDQESKITSISVPGSSSTSYHTGGRIPPEFIGKEVSVILRPSAEVAETSIDCFDIWNKEILFEGILVEQKEE